MVSVSAAVAETAGKTRSIACCQPLKGFPACMTHIHASMAAGGAPFRKSILETWSDENADTRYLSLAFL